MRHRAQYARGAETALQGVVPREGALHLVERAAFGEPLHRHDVRGGGLGGVLGAAAHRAPVAEHRAGAAYAVLAADVNPESLELVAEKVAQQHESLGLTGAAMPGQ